MLVCSLYVILCSVVLLFFKKRCSQKDLQIYLKRKRLLKSSTNMQFGVNVCHFLIYFLQLFVHVPNVQKKKKMSFGVFSSKQISLFCSEVGCIVIQSLSKWSSAFLQWFIYFICSHISYGVKNINAYYKEKMQKVRINKRRRENWSACGKYLSIVHLENTETENQQCLEEKKNSDRIFVPFV